MKTRLIWTASFCLACLLAMPCIVMAQEGSGAKKGSDSKGSDSKSASSEDYSSGPGIAVGEEFPDIKLNDQNGKEVSVHELLKSNNVALVFYRSADW